MVRIPTKGIVEYPVKLGTIRCKFIDMGGQKGERKAWTLCFSEVTSILFFIALSEYDQTLREDRHTVSCTVS